MLWPNVEKYRDGDQLNAATLNDPIDQLIARTEYLKRVLEASDGRTNVAIANATLSEAGGAVPALGQPVYRVPGGNAYAQAKAWADVGRSEWFWADHQAMAVGIVGSSPGTGTSPTATVVLGGYVSFGAGIPVAGVIADADPKSGRYFLSATAGKLTAAPTGPIVYVCDCEIANGKVMSMLVNPQYRDTGESHIHRAFVLSGRPSGYAAITGSRYRVSNIVSARFLASVKHAGDNNHNAAFPSDTMVVQPYGYWASSASITYTLRLEGSGTAWSGYRLAWTSNDHTDDGVGEDALAFGESSNLSTKLYRVGTHGLKVQLRLWPGAGGTAPGPRSFFDNNGTSDTWTVAMPDAGRAWLDYWDPDASTWAGYRLNLGMYPEMARFVPPLPANGAEFTVGGVELRGAEFGARKQWEISPADSAGGPWLCWYGGGVVGDGTSPTAPFEYNATVESQTERDLVLHVNRMRVGPTGFVTSLQPAPGSPLKVTSAQTGANAVQGALQVGLDVDFKSESGNAEGHEVVKRIVGSTFVTGPVVERIVAGPGMAVDHQQGTVTVSASNAVYAGDFETIALKNAKQDLAGEVFPYTKLLKWESGSGAVNVKSGFTAKFRVPDHIPYNAGHGYYVVVSASVFGEADSANAASAAFKVKAYALADQACSPSASGTFDGSVADLRSSAEQVVAVPFAAGYSMFDPVLVHGFRNDDADVTAPGTLVLPNTAQRVRDQGLWLGSSGARIVVYPGYFVGLVVERCGLPSNSTARPYVPAIGFLSLRWNLVPVS